VTWAVRRGDEVLGTFSRREIESAFGRGDLRLDDVAVDEATGREEVIADVLARDPGGKTSPDPPRAAAPVSDRQAGVFVRRVARWEQISGVVWIVIAVFQILTVLGAFAGIWNIIAARSRFRMARFVRSRHPSVPAAYEEALASYLVIGIVNLALGGVFAAFWILFDLYVRRQVLRHRSIFEGRGVPAP